MKNRTGPWKRSIGLRFSIISSLGIFFTGMIFTLFGSYYSYTMKIEDLDRQFDQIEQSHMPAVLSSLWLTDYELLDEQLQAILRYPYVSHVQIVSVEGMVFSHGTEKGLNYIRSRPLVYERRGSAIELGQMSIHIDQRALQNDVFRQEAANALYYLVVTLLTALIVAFLFYRLVGNHLIRVAGYVKKAGSADEKLVFELQRNPSFDDELTSLVTAIRGMHCALLDRMKEREILLGEVQHRVKNDLGFLMALLGLQAQQQSEPGASQALLEASQRVSVMAEIYSRLYGSPDSGDVSLDSLVESVIRDMDAKAVLPAAVVHSSLVPVVVPASVSLAFGVILTELLTNAAKYARPVVDSRFRIDVTLSVSDKARYACLRLGDNGPGFSPGIISGEASGFGFTVIRALIEQHKGSLQLSNSPGATVLVCI